MMKKSAAIVVTLSAFLSLASASVTCSNNPLDIRDKCVTVACTRDKECYSFDCESGICWSTYFKPAACL